MDAHGYHFVIMVKGMNKLVNSLIQEVRESFENKWAQYIDEYAVYGTTIRRKLCESDEKERYFPLFHSSVKEGEKRALLAKKLRKTKSQMMRHTNEEIEFPAVYKHYYRLHYNDQTGAFLFPEDRTDVIELENELSGYFCIITSENMDAKAAINFYKSRDTSEKLFRGDKSYLGDKNLRVYGDSAADSKTFIE